MTIDERIERLTERHEALTQSVEILVATSHENSAQIAALTKRMDSLSDETTKKMDVLIDVETRLAESMTALAQVVAQHERRLNGIENK